MKGKVYLSIAFPDLVVIENTFGILVSRWRIILNKIYASPDNVTSIVLACIALYNCIKLNSLPQNQYCLSKYKIDQFLSVAAFVRVHSVRCHITHTHFDISQGCVRV